MSLFVNVAFEVLAFSVVVEYRLDRQILPAPIIINTRVKDLTSFSSARYKMCNTGSVDGKENE